MGSFHTSHRREGGGRAHPFGFFQFSSLLFAEKQNGKEKKKRERIQPQFFSPSIGGSAMKSPPRFIFISAMQLRVLLAFTHVTLIRKSNPSLVCTHAPLHMYPRRKKLTRGSFPLVGTKPSQFLSRRARSRIRIDPRKPLQIPKKKKNKSRAKYRYKNPSPPFQSPSPLLFLSSQCMFLVHIWVGHSMCFSGDVKSENESWFDGQNPKKPKIHPSQRHDSQPLPLP